MNLGRKPILNLVTWPFIGVMAVALSSCGNPERPSVEVPVSASTVISPRDLAKPISSNSKPNSDIFAQAVINDEIYASDKEAFEEALAYIRKQNRIAFRNKPGVQNNITKDAILIFYKEVKEVVDQIKIRNLLGEDEVEKLLDWIGHRYLSEREQGLNEDFNRHYMWEISEESKNKLQKLKDVSEASDERIVQNFLGLVLGEN